MLDHGNLWLHRLDRHMSSIEAWCQRFEERDRMLRAEEGGRAMSTISSVTLDQPSYPPGATMTMTVTGNWLQDDEVTVKTPDGASGTADVVIVQPVEVDDPTGRTWTPVSNTGTQAVLTSPA